MNRIKLPVAVILAAMIMSPVRGLPQSVDVAPEPPKVAVSGMTQEQAQRVLDLLNDPQKRAAFADSLQAVSKALPVAQKTPDAPVAVSTPVPVTAPPTSPAVAPPKTTTHLVANGVVAQLLLQASKWVSALSMQMVAAARSMSDVPALYRWVLTTLDTPGERNAAIDALWKLGAMFLVAIGVELGLRRLMKSPLDALVSHIPDEPVIPEPLEGEINPVSQRRLHRSWDLLRRLPFQLLYFVLSLLPIAAFMVLGNLLPGLGLIDSEDATVVFLALANAYVLTQIILTFSDVLLAPHMKRRRILGFSDSNASYTAVWVRRLTIVTIAGFTMIEIGGLLGMNPNAHDALQKLVMLLVHVCLVIIVLQNRVAVGNLIRRAWRGPGVMELLLGRFAAVWHFLAIAIIMGLWVVWAAELHDGYAKFLHFFFTTCCVIFVARLIGILVLGGLDHSFRVQADDAAHTGLLAKVNLYYPLLRGTITGILVFTAILALLQVWGIDALAWFAPNKLGSRVLSLLAVVAITLLVAIAVWEMVSTAIDQHVVRLELADQSVKLARLQTLQPILKSALLGAIFVMAGLTILSELGINIAPLLAGAGIVGVAIGFGSQKLVQDFITGIFLLMENAMQVGDWVTVAGLSGSVEHLSIRTIRLRAGDGSVHIIPFSSVTTVNNSNRGRGNAAVSVNVSSREDTDRVGTVLKEIAAEMKAETDYEAGILGEFELWGVDKIDGRVVTLAGQIACTDKARWGVQREFNRRMKKRFEELGIETGIPTHATITISDTPKPIVNPSGTVSDSGDSSTTLVESPPTSALGNKG